MPCGHDATILSRDNNFLKSLEIKQQVRPIQFLINSSDRIVVVRAIITVYRREITRNLN